MEHPIPYFFEKLSGFAHQQLFEGLTYPWEALEKTADYLQQVLTGENETRNDAVVKGNCYFEGKYYIGKGTVIGHGSAIQGPVYIGENCKIQPGALIRPGTIVGDGCEIGHGSEVKHTIMMNKAKIASLSFVGDSILGASARIGSGVITANRKFNQSCVNLKLDGVIISTSMDFFGVILGDCSRLGANAVTQPGTLIGPHSWIYPGTVVRGFIPRQKRVHYDHAVIMEENEIIELKP